MTCCNHKGGKPTRGLLASPYFWVGGLISLAIWAYVISVVFA